MQQQATDDQATLGFSIILCLLFFVIFFGCWRQLTLTRQATCRFTVHLNWPLYNKEICGLPNAVPGNAAACGEVLANTSTKMVLVHMVRLNDMVMQTSMRYSYPPPWHILLSTYYSGKIKKIKNKNPKLSQIPQKSPKNPKL